MRKSIITGMCLTIFIILTYLVSTGQEMAFDTVIREWFYSLRTPWLTEVVKAITFMGNTETIVAICVLLLILPLVAGVCAAKREANRSNTKEGSKFDNISLQITVKIGVPIAIVAIVGSAINKAIKHIMLRPRPDVSLHLIEQGGWSFPSGHSISALLLYGFLAWLILHCAENGMFGKKEVTVQRFVNAGVVLLTILWICIGISRIYLGVHYPTDVLGGWMLGMVIMMAGIAMIEKLEKRK